MIFLFAVFGAVKAQDSTKTKPEKTECHNEHDAPQREETGPITATTFVLMPKQAKDAARTAEALKFFRWSLEQGKADAKSLNYVSLPDGLVKQVEGYWTQNIK